MKKILTGLKPTGELTLGNYIGSILQMKEMQEKYESYIFIADMHAITVQQNPKELHERIKKFIALYIACGIDPNKNTIYLQSENEYISNISWLLECNTYYGEASRMIQFKEKKKKNANFSVGLLTYPILMAADILYLDSDFVPVGIDQKQHVELSRDIAARFNKIYGDTFNLPQPLISKEGIKIKDLKFPEKKMSKSDDNPNGVITLLDTKEEITKKIMSATTDSEKIVKFDEKNKPGISNLINICIALTEDTVDSLERKFEGKNYGDFKKYTAQIVIEELEKIQKRYYELFNSDELNEILDQGARKTREIARAKFEIMKKKWD